MHQTASQYQQMPDAPNGFSAGHTGDHQGRKALLQVFSVAALHAACPRVGTCDADGALLCRSKHDRLAYAIHAFLLADGYKLVAAGKDAEKAPKGECMALPFSAPLLLQCKAFAKSRP